MLGKNSNFNQKIEFLTPSNENREFIAFLLPDQVQNLMANNSLSIHIETEDILYQNFNTCENFYDYILAEGMIRQLQHLNEFHTIAVLKITYKIFYHLFQSKMLKNLINAKYLFNRFNDYMKTSGRKRQIIKHTLKMKDSISLNKIEETRIFCGKTNS